MSRAVLALLLAATLLPGCFGGGYVVEAGSLVLTMTLRNTGEGDREGGLGPHCATARVQDGRVVVEQDSTAAQRRHPVLVVDSDHDWESGWVAVSTDPFALPLDGEAVVKPHVDGQDVPVARISWDGEGDPRVEGVFLPLPAEWTFRSPDGFWEADLRLEKGPRTVDWRGVSDDLCM